MQVLWKPQRDKHASRTRSSVPAYFSVLPEQSIKVPDLLAQRHKIFLETHFYCVCQWYLVQAQNSFLHHVLPAGEGKFFYCLLKQSHRMLCRLQVLSGISFLLAKVYYHLSKIKTELNRTVLVVRTKTVLFKERHKQTHWPQVQPWEQQAAPGAHVRSQHQQMILWGMVISLLLCNL